MWNMKYETLNTITKYKYNKYVMCECVNIKHYNISQNTSGNKITNFNTAHNIRIGNKKNDIWNIAVQRD